MNNPKLVFWGIMLLILGFVAGSFSSGEEARWGGRMGWESKADRMGMGGRMGGMGMDLDRHFIEQMIPHHEGAIAMAELALAKGRHEEIKSLARGIIEAQERENAQMRTWHADWFGGVPDVSSGMMMHTDGMTGDLGALEAASDFDVAFIDQMIPHHEMGIIMTRMMLGGTDRPELRELADQIITSQSREIEMMRSWRRAWAGR